MVAHEELHFSALAQKKVSVLLKHTKDAFLQQIINTVMCLIKNAFVRFWPATVTDNKHFWKT